MRTIISWIRSAWAHEPLVIGGVAAAVGEAVVEDAQDGRLSWHVTVPLAVALIVRQFVTSPASRAQLEADLKAAQQVATAAGQPAAAEVLGTVGAEIGKGA